MYPTLSKYPIKRCDRDERGFLSSFNEPVTHAFRTTKESYPFNNGFMGWYCVFFLWACGEARALFCYKAWKISAPLDSPHAFCQKIVNGNNFFYHFRKSSNFEFFSSVLESSWHARGYDDAQVTTQLPARTGCLKKWAHGFHFLKRGISASDLETKFVCSRLDWHPAAYIVPRRSWIFFQAWLAAQRIDLQGF